jgi:hypothetical protein
MPETSLDDFDLAVDRIDAAVGDDAPADDGALGEVLGPGRSRPASGSG